MGVPRISSEIKTGWAGKSPFTTLILPIILPNWFCWAQRWLGMAKDARSANKTTARHPVPIRHPTDNTAGKEKRLAARNRQQAFEQTPAWLKAKLQAQRHFPASLTPRTLAQ